MKTKTIKLICDADLKYHQNERTIIHAFKKFKVYECHKVNGKPLRLGRVMDESGSVIMLGNFEEHFHVIKEGTTEEQWIHYLKACEDFSDRMNQSRPVLSDFKDTDSFETAIRRWNESLSMDAPNEPGYYRANND